MRKATFKDMASRSAGYRLPLAEAAQLPRGSLFCDKMGRWLVTTKLSPNEIVDHLKTVNWRFRSKKGVVEQLVGKANLLAISFRGHRKTGWTTEKVLGEIPKLPTLMGSYHTHSNGWGDEFSCSTVKEGDEFEHEGKIWSCVYKKYTPGNAECFSSYGMLAVRLA